MKEISVVIPTYQEGEEICSLLNYLKQSAKEPNNVEFIVANYDEGKLQVGCGAKSSNVNMLDCLQKGRAFQMNEGAKISVGKILYFLHCDSKPPKHWDSLIINYVSKGYSSGCFQMKFDLDHWFLNMSGWFTRFNGIICRGGDQSLFITRDLFEKIDGFPKIPIMEDMEIINNITKHTKFGIIPATLVTSARKYKRNGVFYLQYHFAFLHLLRVFGANYDRMVRYYQKHIK